MLAIEYLRYVGDSESGRAALLGAIATQALHIMRRDRPLWPAVEALAAALLETPTVMYDDAANVVRRAFGT